MLTTEECPEMNVGTGKFSGDVEMTVGALTMYSGSEFQIGGSGSRKSSAADGGDFDRRYNETFPVKLEPLRLLY